MTTKKQIDSPIAVEELRDTSIQLATKEDMDGPWEKFEQHMVLALERQTNKYIRYFALAAAAAVVSIKALDVLFG